MIAMMTLYVRPNVWPFFSKPSCVRFIFRGFAHEFYEGGRVCVYVVTSLLHIFAGNLKGFLFGYHFAA